MDEQQMMFPKLVQLTRSMLAEGADMEAVLEALREKSPSVIQAVKVIRETLEVSLAEAKDLVHHSRAWSDMRDELSELHDRAEEASPENLIQREHGSASVQIDLRKED